MSNHEINTLRRITLQNALAHRELLARYAVQPTTPTCVSRSLQRLLNLMEVAA